MPTYRNNFEKKVAAQLGPTYNYESRRLPYTITCHYLPDFIDEANRSIVEAKGLFTSADRRKHKAIKHQYPDWSVCIVFQNPDKKLSKTSNTSYSDWCDRQGIAWRKA
ncbi:endonuclease I [Agrobacterium rosae]|uniref:Endonuclease I n=2 Tax=Agrobacterium rosae TaxID=1972867 RepID=A0A1R3U3E6_9HYPH|nr:endonuclease I [Agrobacterium rosae]